MIVKGRHVEYVDVDIEEEEIINQAICCVRRRLNIGEHTQLNEERDQIVYHDAGYGGSGTWRTLRPATEADATAFDVVNFLEDMLYKRRQGVF